jgi:glycine dehydrogenase subunit 1
LRELAIANTAAAHRVAERLVRTGRWQQQFSAPFFNEFVVRSANAEAAWKTADGRGVAAGLPLRHWYPELSDALLLCVTEMHDAAAADALVGALSQ